jgi:hypothetical protein
LPCETKYRGDTIRVKNMKEVFTKKFWREVKKTFDEAREGASPQDHAADAPAEGGPNASAPAVTASSPSAANEQPRGPAPADE